MTHFRKSSALTLAALLMTSGAQAANYTFIQEGFSEGAFISGTFEANDNDGSGEIIHLSVLGSYEVTALSGTFSGNSIVGAFSFDLTDLLGLLYDHQNGSQWGDSDGDYAEGISIESGVNNYDAGTGPGLFCTGSDECGWVSEAGNSDYTTQFAFVSPASVPLPGSAALLAFGAGAFAVARNRKTRR